jgi:hypothetical protein
MARPDVLLLRWPEEDHRRPEHAGLARPTVLIVERGGPVPDRIGPLEDWLYDDAPPEEVALRVELLASRVDEREAAPVLEDGLLRHRGRWVAISDTQLPVVRLLVARLDHLVPTDAIVDAYASAGGSTVNASFRALMHRVTRRLAEVDLRLHSIRGKGVVVTVAPPPRPRLDLAPWTRGRAQADRSA